MFIQEIIFYLIALFFQEQNTIAAQNAQNSKVILEKSKKYFVQIQTISVIFELGKDQLFIRDRIFLCQG